MWYFLAALGGAVVGVFLFAIVVADSGRDDYDIGFWVGFAKGQEYERTKDEQSGLHEVEVNDDEA